MKVSVLGSGVVGRTLSAKIAPLGHDVMVGTRDVDRLMKSTETGPMTPQTFAAWLDGNPEVRVGAFAESAGHGEVIFNATNGAASIEALSAAGSDNLSGKTLIDTSNALDFSAGFPPTLFTSSAESLAEQIQAAFPDARVVKALNTVTAPLMVEPTLVGEGAHDIFIAGNDQGAKEEVSSILRQWFGWPKVTDLGDLSAARGMEMYLPLWLRLMGVAGSPVFNIRVVM